jgi:chaperone modulatory protein CbpM
MRPDDVLAGAALDEACLTLRELAGSCAVTEEWVVARVTEGLLPAAGGTGSTEWRFGRRELVRVRHMHAMERDFDAVPELAALVADLLEEVETLRQRLRRAGLE